MTDSLRNRIAAAALNTYEGRDEAWAQSEGNIVRQDWLEIADAVIAELGLRTEWGRLDSTDSGAIYDSLEDALAAIDLPKEKLRIRLVTNWVDVQQG